MSEMRTMPTVERSEADAAFEKAVRELDFKGIEDAMNQGADPNRPFVDQWRPGEGCRPAFSLIKNFDRRDLARTGLGAESFAQAHALALKAMISAGADFSLPLFPGSNAQCADPASQLWRSSDGLNMTESLALFAKGKGDMSKFYGEGQFTGLLSSDRASDPASLETLWEAGWEERLRAQGMKTTTLTKLLGYGHLESARWLAGKGATPAPLIERGGTSYEEAGQTALHVLALGVLRYSPAPGTEGRLAKFRRLVSVDQAIECARFAVELGVDPNALASGGSAAHFALWSQDQEYPEGAALWVLELHKLGAKPIATGKGVPFLGMALSDPGNLKVKIEAALAMGCDPKIDGKRAALAMLQKCGPSHDCVARETLSRLMELGADLSEKASVPAEQSLQYAAARAGMTDCLALLYDAGCDPLWKCPKTGASVAGVACQVDESAQSKPTAYDKTLSLAIKRGAPLDSLGGEGMAPLHWAGRHLAHRKCEALLAAGADPNQKSVKGDAPLHWACARNGARHEPRQKKVLEAFLSSAATDWALADKKGRAPLAILSRKASPDILSLAAGVSPDGLNADSVSGAEALKRLAKREDGAEALAAVESAVVGASVESPKPKAGRARKGAL